METLFPGEGASTVVTTDSVWTGFMLLLGLRAPVKTLHQITQLHSI
jgi:hypothetical protein